MPFIPHLTLAALLAALASTTVAGEPPERHHERFPVSIAAAEQRLQARFAELDSDGSQNISMQEFEHAGMRAGREGRAPGQHKGQHRRHHSGGPQHGRRADLKAAIQAESFALLDADGDGSISKAEHNAADTRKVRQTARQRALFKHLDADKNGTLELAEMSHRLERLRAADSNEDGEVSREEMRSQFMQRRGGA